MPTAGVARSSAPLTAEERDSIAKARAHAFAEMAKNHPPTGVIRDELESSKRQAALLAQRVGTAGNSNVHVPMGEGMGGVGAVGGGGMGSAPPMGTIGLSLFSSGPTAAQRKRDSVINADNRARLERLNARVLAMRDSARADSLRRRALADSIRRRTIADSVRRDSIARARSVPGAVSLSLR